MSGISSDSNPSADGAVPARITDATTAIATLKHRYPWPERRPDVPVVPWVMDYGGRELIKHLIATRQTRVIVEIGAFVGGSVLQWLEVSPDVMVVAIDPWPQFTAPSVSNTWLIDDRPWTVPERVMWVRGLHTALRRHVSSWVRARRGRDSAGNPARHL